MSKLPLLQDLDVAMLDRVVKKTVRKQVEKAVREVFAAKQAEIKRTHKALQKKCLRPTGNTDEARKRSVTKAAIDYLLALGHTQQEVFDILTTESTDNPTK